MSARAAKAIVEQLHGAGLKLSLAPAGGLAVAPSRHLTEELRDLIRGSKALLIDWLAAANDEASKAPEPTPDPSTWHELAAAYHAHHFACQACIAAGRGSQYGQRYAVGITLWRKYAD